MTRVVFKNGDPFTDRGVWSSCMDAGKRKAVISCPLCGGVSFLGHEIAEDGTVAPSVVHDPEDGCTFHEFVQLKGWKK